MFILYNNDSEEFETFTLTEVLEMVNRDRSDEWSGYDENSTIAELSEAIDDFCDPYSVEEDMPLRTGSYELR